MGGLKGNISSCDESIFPITQKFRAPVVGRQRRQLVWVQFLRNFCRNNDGDDDAAWRVHTSEQLDE